jgi:hypothetical protein
MLTLDKQFLIVGSEVTLNWDVPKTNRRLFLWIPTSFFFWENYTPIESRGSRKLIVNKNILIAEIRELKFPRFRIIHSLSVPVNLMNLKNVASKIRVENASMQRNTIFRDLNVDVKKGFKINKNDISINKSDIRINKNDISIKNRKIFLSIKSLKTVKKITRPEIINL